MSRTAFFSILGAVLALASTGAHAQTAEKTTSDDRFIYDQVDEGILRLDSRSGEVSLCSRQENTGWACRIVADERGAVDGEIGRLQRENTEMRKLLSDSGLTPPGAAVSSAKAVPQASQAEPAATAPVPRSAEKSAEKPAEKSVETPAEKKPAAVQLGLGRTMEVAETIWRRLVEMMANVKADLQRRS